MGSPPFRSSLPPAPEAPVAAPSEDQKEHEDNENEAHGFLLKIGCDFCLLYVGVELIFTNFGFYLCVLFRVWSSGYVLAQARSLLGAILIAKLEQPTYVLAQARSLLGQPLMLRQGRQSAPLDT
jgi:hypothetical protein